MAFFDNSRFPCCVLGFVSNAAHFLRPHLFVHGSRGAVDRNDGSSNRWLASFGRICGWLEGEDHTEMPKRQPDMALMPFCDEHSRQMNGHPNMCELPTEGNAFMEDIEAEGPATAAGATAAAAFEGRLAGSADGLKEKITPR